MTKPTIIVLIIFVALFISLVWLNSRTYPVTYGISFNQNHAVSLGLDWKNTYISMLEELRPAYIRIAAMWSEVEREKGVYDFTDVDWMMTLAEQHGTQVTLVVGQKAPRWPECHIPAWLDRDDYQSREYLFDYISAVVQRYSNHPALEIWQVENEPFIHFKFGECAGYRSDFVQDEIALVKKIDKNHPVLITDSGELSTWRVSSRAGDYFGTTLYRIVRMPNGRIWTYDWLPAVTYRIKAALWGRDIQTMFVSELQAEPWFTDAGAEHTSVEEQEKTMNPERLEKHLQFVTHIGVPRAYLWGVEWWDFMRKKQGDERYWELIKNYTHRN